MSNVAFYLTSSQAAFSTGGHRFLASVQSQTQTSHLPLQQHKLPITIIKSQKWNRFVSFHLSVSGCSRMISVKSISDWWVEVISDYRRGVHLNYATRPHAKHYICINVLFCRTDGILLNWMNLWTQLQSENYLNNILGACCITCTSRNLWKYLCEIGVRS